VREPGARRRRKNHADMVSGAAVSHRLGVLETRVLDFLQVLVSVLVLNLGVLVLVLKPQSLGLGLGLGTSDSRSRSFLGTCDHEDSVFVTHEA